MTVDDIHDISGQLANFRAYYLGYGCVDRSDDPVAYFRSGVANPALNGILRVRPGHFAEAMTVRLDLASALGGVPVLWWTAPDSYPDLAADLTRDGAIEVGTMPVMAARIADVAGGRAGRRALTIDVVDNPGALYEWVRAYAVSLGVSEADVPAAALMESKHPESGDRLVRFSGRLDGQIVATSAVLLSGGVAGIYAVTTHPACRGHGFGAEMTRVALGEASRRGMRVVTLQATGDGEGLYRRMGFTTVGEHRIFSF